MSALMRQTERLCNFVGNSTRPFKNAYRSDHAGLLELMREKSAPSTLVAMLSTLSQNNFLPLIRLLAYFALKDAL
jgi:hypothetical protein